MVDYQTYKRTNLKKQQRFLSGLVARGIRPIPRGTWFVSAAHSMDDVEETVVAATAVLSGNSRSARGGGDGGEARPAGWPVHETHCFTPM